MAFFQFALIFSLVSVLGAQSVYLLGHDFDEYAFTCLSGGTLAALSKDKHSVLFYDVIKKELIVERKLSHLGQQLKWSPNSENLFVVHDSYISTLNAYNETTVTFPTKVAQASSVEIIDDLVCLAVGSLGSVVCLNMTTSEVKTCLQNVTTPQTSMVADQENKWVYLLNTNVAPQTMYKFLVKDSCLVLNNTKTSKLYYGGHLWFAKGGLVWPDTPFSPNGGPRILLENGLTLTVSSNPNGDMLPHGNFNSSYSDKKIFTWFTQSAVRPFNVAGLRSDMAGSVIYYSWPFLEPVSVNPVPTTSNGKILANGNQQVHSCSERSLIVISTYEESLEKYELGVAYMIL